MFKTEYEFVLPRGFVDRDGNIHKKGKMRLATAADEILPMNDPKVKLNPSYLSIILLSRVVVSLGELDAINTKTIEKLFTADLSFLQDMYHRINQVETPTLSCVCPKCNEGFEEVIDFFQINFSNQI